MLSFEQDEFIAEKYESDTRWVVTLSDGRCVYQDDDRPGASPASSWLRLGIFLKNNPELHIIKMTVGFRDNIISLPENADGYFFSKGVVGMLGTPVSCGFYTIGTLNDDILSVEKRKIPELSIMESETRPKLTAGESLICRNFAPTIQDINQ